MKSKIDTEEMVLQACILHEKGKYRAVLQKAARLGEKKAFHNLAYAYDTGLGVKLDKQRAIKIYKQAWAKEGQSSSLYNIGLVYQDLNKPTLAKKWLEKARKYNDSDAMLRIAQIICADQNATRRDMKVAAARLKQYLAAKDTFPDERKMARQLLRKIKKITSKYK